MGFEHLAAERKNPKRVDGKSTEEILRAINEEDSTVPTAVGAVIDRIARAVDGMCERIKNEEARTMLVPVAAAG